MSDVMMTMQAEASGERLPDGSYYAIYRGNERTPAREYQGKMLEAGVRWNFEVSRGPCKGKRLGPITGSTPKPNTACGRTLAGVLGRMPSVGEAVNLQQCVGGEYIVTVSGGKVTGVSQPPAQ